MEKLTIITPCTRIQNLSLIATSLQTIPKEKRRWIIVFDNDNIPSILPEECEAYCIQDENSIVGNAQRNYALNLVTEGHVYFVDDDACIHPDLWKFIKNASADIISFKQGWKNGGVRLAGDIIGINHIDSHNFIVSKECIGDIRWEINEYAADGIFAEECYRKAKTTMYIPVILSIYNSLR